MYTVDLPLTDAEVKLLETMAAAAAFTVGELVAAWVREELEATGILLTPNLG